MATFDCETIAVEALRAVLLDDRLQALQSSRLEIHVEAPPLEGGELDVVEEAVVVDVADFEDPGKRLLALLSQLIQNRHHYDNIQ